MRFWDSSAIISLLVQEPETALRERQLAEDQDVVTCWYTRLECAAALMRLERDGHLDAHGVDIAYRSMAELSRGWTEIQASTAVQERALRLLRVHPLRSGAALQLASALVTADDAPAGFPFLCSDPHLADAARREGFSTLDA